MAAFASALVGHVIRKFNRLLLDWIVASSCRTGKSILSRTKRSRSLNDWILWRIHDFQYLFAAVIPFHAKCELERRVSEHYQLAPTRLDCGFCRIFCEQRSSAIDRNLGSSPAASEKALMIGVILLAFVGGAIGSVWRYSLSGWVAQRIGETLPVGTLVVNLTGSLLIGFVANYARSDLHREFADIVRVFVAVGICGGLTTFSSFILQTFHLLREKRFWIALANTLFSTVLCIGMVVAGWWLATLVLG